MNKLQKIMGVGALVVASALSGGCDDFSQMPKQKDYQSLIETGKKKVLTLSIEEYCKSVGKSPSDYNLVGVQDSSGVLFNEINGRFYINMAENSNIEAVVNVTRESSAWYADKLYGTALVPKKK